MHDKWNSPKFPMRDTHSMKSLKTCFVAIMVALSASASLYLFRSLPHKAAYRDFYADYDPPASFKRMLEGVYIQSSSLHNKFNEKNNSGPWQDESRMLNVSLPPPVWYIFMIRIPTYSICNKINASSLSYVADDGVASNYTYVSKLLRD
uniref:Uncharacterized protein n=1 Tax=Glossina palpalis gambiensis TaxID=67801 RepID=A0A1B0B8C3_9MUSC